MTAGLDFTENLRGYAAFGESVPEIGAVQGRADGTTVALKLSISVGDVNRFIGGPDRWALVRGSLRFDELGGEFPIIRGLLQILPPLQNPHQGRMLYRAGIRLRSHGWLTFVGVKFLKSGRGATSLQELRTVRFVLRPGEPEFAPGDGEMAWSRAVTHPTGDDTLAAGELVVSPTGCLQMLASFRSKARSRTAGAASVARFWAAVAGAVGDIYLPERLNAGRPSPAADAAEVVAADPVSATPRVIRDRAWSGDLRVTQVPVLEANRGGGLVGLEHVEAANGRRPTKGPVLLIAGSSVAASIFRPVGVTDTIVHRLLREGYDVWAENWRGSLDHRPREYSLDEAAAVDHPAAVKRVAEVTGARDVKAVVHCLGSSGFMLALASGRLHTDAFRVTNVVSNAVSLHPMLPPGAEVKIRTMVPVYNRVLAYLDPQWAREPPLIDEPLAPVPEGALTYPPATSKGVIGRALVAWVRATHHECENDVCNFAQFMYGAGPSTLYEESRLNEATARWMESQFAWAPARLYRQIARSLLAGHLVPMRQWQHEHLRMDVFEAGPPAHVDSRITFMTGTRNRCFAPLGQQRTYEWFCAHQPHHGHDFRPLHGYGHLDVWVGREREPVDDVVLAGLSA